MKKVSTQHISEVRKRNGLIDIAIGDFDRLIFKRAIHQAEEKP